MFTTPLRVEALEVEDYWVLLAPLVWDDGLREIIVPVGFVTDLASIPAPMRGILDSTGRSRKPAVLHDFLYKTGIVSRRMADELFLDALASERVINIGRGLYYLGVRAFGWIPFNRYRKVKP